MYLEQAQYGTAQQSINISAKLIASIKILQYSAEELEQSIARELTENPALELEELSQCLHCGTPLRHGLCPLCDRRLEEAADPRRDDSSWDDAESYARGADLAASEESDYDPLDFVRSAGTLREHLLRQLGALIDRDDAEIAEYLVGSLNSHGYMTVSVVEAAEALKVEARRVERVLEWLQLLDPPGIGARDLRECLLIQLRSFEERGEAPQVVRLLIEQHLHELGEHHFADIARQSAVTLSQVKHAWRFIKANLNPYPAHAFESSDVPGLGLTGDDHNVVIRPDVVIRRTEHGFEADVIERRRFRFNVSSMYGTLYQACRPGTHAHVEPLSDHERQHVREYASRARFFMECVRQRWDTLSNIATALIECQREFLEHGVRHLRPLTRGELANHIGLHESTVSRATANKYVLLPSGRTVPFDDFFDGSLAAKDLLRELVDAEDPGRPFSDEDLAGLLAERGMPLARRTVAKYREALGILPSRFRI